MHRVIEKNKTTTIALLHIEKYTYPRKKKSQRNVCTLFLEIFSVTLAFIVPTLGARVHIIIHQRRWQR